MSWFEEMVLENQLAIMRHLAGKNDWLDQPLPKPGYCEHGVFLNGQRKCPACHPESYLSEAGEKELQRLRARYGADLTEHQPQGLGDDFEPRDI